MNQEEFYDAFIMALQNKKVLEQLEKSMNQKLQRELADIKQLLQERDDRIKVLEKKIDFLESQNENLEQYTRRNSLRIYGMEESEHEDIFDAVIKLFQNDMDLETQPADIDRIHRLGKKKSDGKPRPVIVKFATYRQRNFVFKAKSRLKNYSNGKVYVNEDLTKERSNLFFAARKLKKEKKIQDAWTFDGRVIIKTRQGRITTVGSLQQLDDAAK